MTWFSGIQKALATISLITGGNFRLVQRLFSQIEWVLEINQIRIISREVVEAACESLVIGPAGRGTPLDSAEDLPPFAAGSYAVYIHVIRALAGLPPLRRQQ